MTNLFRYYLYSILIVSFAICSDVHKHGWFLSYGLSDFTYKMWNEDIPVDENSSHSASLGYSRVDLNGVRSGWGFMYLTQLYTPSDENYSYNKDLIGLNLVSFINKPIIGKNMFKFNVGFKSYFNLGGAYNNIAIGPTLGLSFKGFSLDYFKGCMDLIDFSTYTDEINLRIFIRKGNND